VLNNTFIKRFSYIFFRQDEQDGQDSHLIYPDNPVYPVKNSFAQKFMMNHLKEEVSK